MRKKVYAWLVLAIIMAFAAVLLAGTNLLTKDVIAMREVQADQNARKLVMPDADDFVQVENKSGLEFLYESVKEGKKIGYVAAIHEKGFAGDIKVILGIKSDGSISGINIGGSNFQETAGLGAKAKEPKFSNQFIGKILPLSLRKGEAEKTNSNVDAITAATITSNAVVRAVNSANKIITALNKSNEQTASSFAGGEAKASVDGFDGPVAVKVSFDKDKKITAIEIGDENFNETAGLGALALEDDFKSQFIGKQAPLKIEDIDAIAGATITSTAVVDAVNQALESLEKSSQGAEKTSFAGGEAKASVDGFDGPVAVKVSFDKDKKITAIEIGDENFNETAGLGALALEDDFKSQFIGKQAPLKIEDIDAIAGATITSTAVVDAVNQALESLIK